MKKSKFIKYDDGSNSLLNTAGPRMTNTQGENFGYTVNPASKTSSKKAPMGDSKVRAFQQKLKNMGYDIKVDGMWGKETQKIYEGYSKDKAADASRRGTVNTGQGPTIQNQRNLVPAMSGKVLPEVTVSAPAKKSYNQFDSPVLRGASADTQARIKQEQAAANARAKARQVEVAKNSQSLPSATSANRFTFNASDKGQGQDMTTAQNEALKKNKLVGTGEGISANGRVQTFGLGTMAAKLFGGNTSSAVPKMPSKLPNKMGSPMVKKGPSTPFNPMAVINKKMPSPLNISSPSKLQFADGTKKVSGYSKLDAKLGGILPGGVTRAEAKAMKASKNATPEGSVGPMAGGYKQAPKPTEGVGPLAGGYSKPAPDLSKPVGPMTDVRRYTNADNMPASSPAKKSLKQQYDENKGGYARALKGGKKDAQGNLVDPNTGLAYKQLPTKTGGTGGKATTATKENSLFKNGVAVKNFKDPKTGRTFYTNGRVFDEKTGRMAKYSHDAKNKKVNLQWDKAKPKKGDDTYMDEIIDFGSRAAGSIGGGALAGGSTFGVGTAAGAIAGDMAGKKFGNWLNKKLGYREENDTSQEGYSIGEGAMAGLGGPIAGRVLKAAAPLASKAGGALIKFAGKEGQKIAQAPLGKAISSIAKSKAGQAVGNVASKAKNAVTGGSKAAAQTASQAASQGAKQSAKLVNAPGSISKVTPTAQSSLSVGNLGKVPTKAVRGQGGRFAKNPANTPVNTTPRSAKMVPERPNRFNPDNAVIRPNGPTALDKIGRAPGTSKASEAAASSSAKAVQNTAKSSVSKTKAVARLARQKGKKAINYAQNNKKKVALGATGIGGLVGGGYALSQMRTSSE